MYTKFELISPNRARLYLEANSNNYRKVDYRIVSQYADDMVNGKWELNGESIKFNKHGELIDGQHRLLAIIKSGKTIRMLVIYDIEDSVSIFDWNRNRRIPQMLVAAGVKNSTHVSSMVNVLLPQNWEPGSVPKGILKDYAVNNADEINDALSTTLKGAATPQLARQAPVIAAAFCLLRMGESKELLSTFFEIVNSGFQTNLYECSPAIVLRNYFLQKPYAHLRTAIRAKTIFSIAVQAFNDFKAGISRRKTYKADYNLADKVRNEAMQHDFEQIELLKEA